MKYFTGFTGVLLAAFIWAVLMFATVKLLPQGYPRGLALAVVTGSLLGVLVRANREQKQL